MLHITHSMLLLLALQMRKMPTFKSHTNYVFQKDPVFYKHFHFLLVSVVNILIRGIAQTEFEMRQVKHLLRR